MSQTPQTLSPQYLTLEKIHLSHVQDSLTSPSSLPLTCMRYHKIICFWQASHWVTYACLGSEEAARKAVQSWRQTSSSSAAHTHKKRPPQSFPWFLFWAVRVVSTVSQAPPKKWHILRPDALDSQYREYRPVLINRALFFVCERGQAIFNWQW